VKSSQSRQSKPEVQLLPFRQLSDDSIIDARACMVICTLVCYNLCLLMLGHEWQHIRKISLLDMHLRCHIYIMHVYFSYIRKTRLLGCIRLYI
jgi:hypothetical protein